MRVGDCARGLAEQRRRGVEGDQHPTLQGCRAQIISPGSRRCAAGGSLREDDHSNFWRASRCAGSSARMDLAELIMWSLDRVLGDKGVNEEIKGAVSALRVHRPLGIQEAELDVLLTASEDLHALILRLPRDLPENARQRFEAFSDLSPRVEVIACALALMGVARADQPLQSYICQRYGEDLESASNKRSSYFWGRDKAVDRWVWDFTERAAGGDSSLATLQKWRQWLAVERLSPSLPRASPPVGRRRLRRRGAGEQESSRRSSAGSARGTEWPDRPRTSEGAGQDGRKHAASPRGPRRSRAADPGRIATHGLSRAPRNGQDDRGEAGGTDLPSAWSAGAGPHGRGRTGGSGRRVRRRTARRREM